MTTFHVIYTAVLLLALVIALAREVMKPAFLIFLVLLLLLAGGVITIQEAFAGFSNQGMITVGFLFIVSASLQASGLFENLVMKILGGRRINPVMRYLRLMVPVAGLSAFLNNTPIVASLIPVVRNWAKKNDLSASKFLIPLSYAAILGGTCTLIGTSTNLIVHGMLLERNLPGIGFFEITRVGLPVALIVILILSLVSHRLLPDRKDVVTQLDEHTREFVVELKVDRKYPHIGKTIEGANLRHLQGLFLFQINRGETSLAPVSPHEHIYEDDRLFFTGLPETIYELQKTPGLHIVEDLELDLRHIDSDHHKTYEAVVSNTSPLIGKTVRDSDFRSNYGAVILAIHRSGERINKKVGDIVFESNDTLFVLADKGFADKWYHSRNFSLVTRSLNVYSKPRWKSNLALILMGLMVAASALKLIPIILAAALTAALMVLLGILNAEDAKNAVNWDVLLYIACSFGIAKALENSGLAGIIANTMVQVFRPWGSAGVLAGLFIMTSIFTWVITNNAVAAIMFPIALSISRLMQMDPTPFMLVLAMGASTCYATPIGYQTNLMVYNVGGYKFKDFFKIGIGLNLLVGVIVIWMIYLKFL